MNRSVEDIFEHPDPKYPMLVFGVEVPRPVLAWLMSLAHATPLGRQSDMTLDFHVDLVCGPLQEPIRHRFEPKRLKAQYERFDKSVERNGLIQMFRKDEAELWLSGQNIGTPCHFGRMTGKFIRPIVNGLEKGQPFPMRIAADSVALWLKVYAMTLWHPDNPFATIARRMYALIEIGWWPIEWVGTTERGYAVAWCPPGHPRQEVPEANRVTEAYRAVALTPVPKRPPLVLPALDVPVVPPTTWAALAALPPSQAFVSHFSFLAETDQCRDLLRRIGERVEKFEVGARQIAVHFLPTEDIDDEEDEVPMQIYLKAPAPYTKELGPLPRSVAELVRRHNGLSFGDDMGSSPTRVPKYDGKRLTIETWDAWWQPDPFDPDEPFDVPPHVVLWHQSDLVVCHSFVERGPGEPVLVPITHDSCQMQAPLPYGIGGLLIRTLGASVLGSSRARDEGWRIPF